MPIPSLAFLIDVDNTLLDNDRAKADEAAYLRRLVGEEPASRFWEIYEQVRHEEDKKNTRRCPQRQGSSRLIFR